MVAPAFSVLTHPNRRTGEAFLMHETSPIGLDAIHMMHDESRNFSRENHEHQEDQEDQP
jgi:hypothetical protein